MYACIYFGALFCSVHLQVSFYANTILFWLLWLCHIVWNEEAWCLLLWSSFSKLLWLFRIFCGHIWRQQKIGLQRKVDFEYHAKEYELYFVGKQESQTYLRRRRIYNLNVRRVTGNIWKMAWKGRGTKKRNQLGEYSYCLFSWSHNEG